VTNFAEALTLDYDFSPDGKQILLLQVTKTAKAVSIRMSTK